MESYGGILPYENDWEIENKVEYDCFSEQPYENILYRNEKERELKKNKGILQIGAKSGNKKQIWTLLTFDLFYINNYNVNTKVKDSQRQTC